MNRPYLQQLPTCDQSKVKQLLDHWDTRLKTPKKGFLRYQTPYHAVADFQASQCDFSSDIVTIGQASDLNPSQHQQLQETLRAFIPWRKGPFSIFGTKIDAEWRSEKKWNRLASKLPDIKGKVVADVGCNNGYYLFRLAHHQPALALGFEPHLHHYYTFKTLNQFAGCQNLHIEPLGVEHLTHFPNCFDLILLLGIIYHRPSPIDTLRAVYTALKPGGTLLIESQAIPGESPYALFPERTYAKVPGTWFVPTGTCLKHWLQRTGFNAVDWFHSHPMSSTEQRKTDWMVFESYEDFIDKQDRTLTIEKYPAPVRVFLTAHK